MTKKEEDKKILTDEDFATDDDMPISGPGCHGITNDEKEEMLKQVLENAGYGYEPKSSKDGDEIWTPCGENVPKESKPMSKETKDKLNNLKRSERLKGLLDEELGRS